MIHENDSAAVERTVVHDHQFEIRESRGKNAVHSFANVALAVVNSHDHRDARFHLRHPPMVPTPSGPIGHFEVAISVASMLEYDSTVCLIPSSSPILARKPNSASAREISKRRRGCPSGFVKSHSTSPSKPVTRIMRDTRSLMEISMPVPRFTGSGLS